MAIYTVDNTGGTPDFTTIQAAIDFASSGDTVQILAGTYSENVWMTSGDNGIIVEFLGTSKMVGLGTGSGFKCTTNGGTARLINADISGYEYQLELGFSSTAARLSVEGANIVGDCFLQAVSNVTPFDNCTFTNGVFDGPSTRLLKDFPPAGITNCTFDNYGNVVAPRNFTGLPTDFEGNSFVNGSKLYLYANATGGYMQSPTNFRDTDFDGTSKIAFFDSSSLQFANIGTLTEYFVTTIPQMQIDADTELGAGIITIEEYSFNIPGQRTFTPATQKGTTYNYLIQSPYRIITRKGLLSFEEIQAQADAGTIVYEDVEETNISSFQIDGQIYSTFEPVTVTPELVKAIRIDGGPWIEICPPCTRRNVACVKFKNPFGVWEYLTMYGVESIRHNQTQGEYQEFSDAYLNVEKEEQKEIRLTRGELPNSSKALAEALAKCANAWVATKWQFSEFTGTIESVAGVDSVLDVNDRIYKYNFANGVDAAEFERRFKAGDRVYFERYDDPFTASAMWGTVLQSSSRSALIRFTTTGTNSGVGTLDSWASSEYELRVCAFDAWELCTIDDRATHTLADGNLRIDLTLRTNPQEGYSY